MDELEKQESGSVSSELGGEADGKDVELLLGLPCKVEYVEDGYLLLSHDSKRMLAESTSRERLDAMCHIFNSFLALAGERDVLDIRCKQYDAIVRGVCNDLGIDEQAGCDEIAMVSANTRGERDALKRFVTDYVREGCHHNCGVNCSHAGKIRMARARALIGTEREK